MSPPAPQVSVVIPVHNAEGILRHCLESVFRSEGVTFEVLVVNDASTDDTEQTAREFPCRVISLDTNVMSANCRNLGARHARGEILVFFDADQLMTPRTLRQYADALEAQPDVDAIVGSLAPDTPMRGFFSKFKNFQHHYTHQTAEREAATLASGLMAIRRRVFETLGGFEPAFAGASVEDIALGYAMRRRGHRIRFEPSIQVVHLKSYTLWQMVRSDIMNRAIPWTGLMLRERMFRSDLNTRGGNVASVTLAWILAVALGGGVFGWWWGWLMAGAAAATIAALNAGLLAGCWRQFGWWFAVRAGLFLPVMYFYHGLGLLAGIAGYVAGRSIARERSAPTPGYRLIEPDGAAGRTP